ncbi:hypothetical protein B0T22DRAFT_440111 [Podospora appendiculata]|uniref:LysM domain-containing protein n=1 Tax=Podospora appendiculata TaxID=314037 RepID=A0AAE0X9K9_9PEZI|nr:hypothetical protein B0T22DRAFT_440111 [Podospora appendiculata]
MISGRQPVSSSTHASVARNRNRRLVGTALDDGAASSPAQSQPQSPTRGASPIPTAHVGRATGRNHSGTEFAPSLARAKSPGFVSSWAPSWASVSDFASSLLLPSEPPFTTESDLPRSRDSSRPRKLRTQTSGYRDATKNGASWGPEPPAESRPRLQDVAAGSQARRESALKAMKTASVLESYEGVNGGLDVTGNYKARNSDELVRSTPQSQEPEAHLVYIHHVQPNDTYAGIVLKYRCREDAFRKANGLWSRDNIQVRKWLALPVDACEVRGRPCDGPTSASAQVDLLARTPEATNPFGQDSHHNGNQDDFFTSGSTNGHPSSEQPKSNDEDRPWTHVRWVSLDSSPSPVEIARVERKALGYFPPRRKKSLHSVSALTTPRGSLDVPSITLGSSEAALESPGSTTSRRPSLLSGNGSGRPSFTKTAYGSSLPGSNPSRSRATSGGDDDARPAWMRRPGGVGSLGKSVRAPGPERDYLNSWTNKHLPGLNIDSLPSMSVMGSETARFGFNNATEEYAGIVESPFGEGADTTSTTGQQGAGGTGLDKAAAAVETWLRGAFAKRPLGAGPGTPVLGPHRGGRPSVLPEEGDLIELTDTNSDDGRGYAIPIQSRGAGLNLGLGTVRGRTSRKAD